MRLKWTAMAALLALTFVLGSCTSTSTQLPPTPVITGLFPSSITAGSQGFTLFISGNGFVTSPQSQVFWNGSMRTSTINKITLQLAVSVLASDVASAGIAAITVTNPEPGGPSLAATFTINAVQNGGPLIASLSPASATPGSGTFTLTVNGSNFVAPAAQTAGSTIAWNSGPLTTTFVNSTSLTASVPASDIATSGSASVSVFNTTPGGSQVFSPAVNFTFMSGSAAFPVVASVNASGGPADGASAAPAMSADGRFAAFFSNARNLVGQGAQGNIFLRDTCLGAAGCVPKTSAVDLAPDGSAPNAGAGSEVAMSADGRFVVFQSAATNLVSDQQSTSAPRAKNLFVRDLCAGVNAPSGCVPNTELVSASDPGALAIAGDSGSASISADGRLIAFASSAANQIFGQTGSGSQVFVRDTCAGPTAGKSCIAGTVEIPIDAEYQAGGAEGAAPAISADGRYVAFVAAESTSVSGAVRNPSQILLRDTCSGSNAPATCVPSTAEISVSPAGDLGNGVSGAPAVSGDGRFVVFQSAASNLVVEASKSETNIFLRDTCLGATASDGCVPSTTLIGPETAGVATNSDAFAPWISASGRYISFISGISTSANGQHSVETFLFVRDTCVGVTSPCTARTVAVAAPVNSSQAPTLDVDQLLPVPIVSNGRVAAFSSTSPVSTAPVSGYGDVLLTLTSF
ncbi:MAG: IPT/TIG domain-containing protein [Candidatus Acidiferrales bacterium]